jgi:hypothetical protein
VQQVVINHHPKASYPYQRLSIFDISTNRGTKINITKEEEDMSSPDLSLQYFSQLLYSLDSNNNPIATGGLQIADGNGSRIWQNVFQVLSTQAEQDNFSLPYLPSTLVSLSNSGATGPTGADADALGITIMTIMQAY